MHATSSTPIRHRNVRKGSPLQHQQSTARASIYSVALSPNVSPVGKSAASLRQCLPPEKEISFHEVDDEILTGSVNQRESTARDGVNNHMTQHTAGNDIKRNVSRQLPVVTAVQRSKQYATLEIVSDEEDGTESKAFHINKTRSCKRQVNCHRKTSFHMKTNSCRGLSAKYDSTDSGKGGSAALMSGMRTRSLEESHLGSCSDPDDPELDSDSGLSHCTEGPSRNHILQDERKAQNTRTTTQKSKFPLKEIKSSRISRFVQYTSKQQEDYEPLEIVTDDDDSFDATSSRKISQRRGMANKVMAGVMARRTGREDTNNFPVDIHRNGRMLNSRNFNGREVEENNSKLKIVSRTEEVIDALLMSEDGCSEKENSGLVDGLMNKLYSNNKYHQEMGDDCETESRYFLPKQRKHLSSLVQEGRQFSLVGASCRKSQEKYYDSSGSEADEPGEQENSVICEQDHRADGFCRRNVVHIGKHRIGEVNESYSECDNSNVSGFTNKNPRMQALDMSEGVGGYSRTRYGESFDSDVQFGDDECGMDEEMDEDLDESGNVSDNQGGQRSSHHRQQRRVVMVRRGSKKGGNYVASCGKWETDASDYEPHDDDDMNLDVSGCTDYKHKSKMPALIHSQNDSYSWKDNCDSQSMLQRKLGGYLQRARNTNLNQNNGRAVRAKKLPCKGLNTSKRVKRTEKSNYSSLVVVSDESTPCQTKLVKNASQMLRRSQTGRCVKKANKNNESPKSINSSGRLSGQKKRLEKVTQNKDKSVVKITKKTSKKRENEKSQAESEPTGIKTTLHNKTKYKSPALKVAKGSDNLQGELSATVKGGSYPMKKKRGRPPGKQKESGKAQKKVQALTVDEETGSKSSVSAEGGSPPKKRKCVRPPKKVKEGSQSQKKAEATNKSLQAPDEPAGTAEDKGHGKKRKCRQPPKKGNKKQKLDPIDESSKVSSDGQPEASSSGSETDKTGVSKRRTLFSNEKFNNELTLEQNQGSLPDGNEMKVIKRQLSPKSGKRKPATESSSDFLRKKVLTMRLGTSAFHNSVIGENVLVVTSTPKKSVSESLMSTLHLECNPVKDQKEEETKFLQPQKKLPVPGQSEVTSGNNEQLDKGQSELGKDGSISASVHDCDEVLNSTIKPKEESACQTNGQVIDPRQGTKCVSDKPEVVNSNPMDLPTSCFKVNDRLKNLPSMSSSVVTMTSNRRPASRDSVKVVVDGSKKELQLFANYSNIPFKIRRKSPADSGVHYGAALDVLGLGTGFIYLPPGTEKGLQNPKSYNMVFLILDGQVMVKIHESDIMANPGDCFAVPKGCKYNLTGVGDTNAVVVYFKSKAP